MRAIQEHTRQIRRERLERQRLKDESMRAVNRRHNRETSHLSSAFSDMDGLVKTARMQGHNINNTSTGVWRVSSRIPTQPYMPILKDAYPRNEYTMMPQQRNAPRFYDGKFLSYNYRDQVQQPPEFTDSGRPVVFKTQAIEKVQTRKKYGQNLKGQSSVPLHLCNDMTSELYQRSLQPSTAISSNPTNSAMKRMVSKYPETPSTTYNRAFSSRWDDAMYTPSWQSRRGSGVSDTTSVYRVKDRAVQIDGKDLRSGKIRSPSLQSEPEWYSSLFPKQKVADALKFMGQAPAVHHKVQKNREYDVNFNGKF